MEELSHDAFFAYLESHNCTIMKTTSYGYLKTRNNKNGKVVGIQPENIYLAATICIYCRALRIPPPPELEVLHAFIQTNENNL